MTSNEKLSAPHPVEGGLPQPSADPANPITPAPGTNTSQKNSSDTSLEKVDTQVKVSDDEEVDELAHLPAHEREILHRQLHVPDVKLNFFSLYRYATTNDKLFIALGAFTAIVGGALMPMMTILFGQLSQTFTNFAVKSITPDKMQSEINRFTLYFVYLAIGEFVMVYVSTVIFIYTGEHVAQKIRQHYLGAILRQNIAFFDKLGAGEITTRITADTNLIQEGISEKIALTLSALATFFAAFVVAFIKSWKLTLILSATVFAISFIMGGGSTFIIKFNKQSLQAYGEGGTVAEEVISSIRNTAAFNTEDKLAKQYDAHLAVAEKWGFKLKFALAMMIAAMMSIVYLNYGLAFWQGSRFLIDGELNVGQLLTVMLSIMIGAFSLGNVAPNAQHFATAVSAAAKIYNTIDRTSPLDPEREDGLKLDKVEGTIELRGIKHIYPSRPAVEVINDMNLVVPAGKVTALVGASGSGKSTIVGLVERFYDPVGGQVFLDGHDVSTLNLRWLRQQISLVSQEPVLFAQTIFENICHGLIGTEHENASDEKKRELAVEACKMSNADGFIRTLPEGYETNVGERGFLMSGGQKQRIAIARAIVSNPKILLLDEATSALDTRSEGVVQAALDTASKGRTTIVIAHRLSTIKDSDNIVVMSQGRIIEQGTHDYLLERQGAYFQLVEAQRITAETEAKAVQLDDDSEHDEDEALKLKVSRTNGSEKQPIQDPADAPAHLTRTTTGKSASSLALKNKTKEGERKYSLWTLIKMTAEFNKTEKLYMAGGLVASIITGGGYPVQAVFFSKSIVALSGPVADLPSEASFWSLMYLMLAIVQFLAFTIQGVCFAFCSERLVHRVRDRAFRTMLRQDIAFFDREENSTGALTSFLSTETTHLAGMSGSTLGTILQVTTTLAASIILACAMGWKLALVCTACIPILLACGFWRFSMLAKFQQRSKKAYERSAGFACEATAAIRTVASLTREQDIWNKYHMQLEAQKQKSIISILRSSILYASSQSLTFLCMALGFWYGGTLIRTGEYGMETFFIVFAAVLFGAQSAGTVFSFAPDMGKAKQAAHDLKVLFDRQPEIDAWSPDGIPLPHISGALEFRDVHFRYPTRPEQPVLRGLNLSVKPGQYIALVGPSGCGKSTTIALIERFYNPLAGGIFVDDNTDISTANLSSYRSHIALVSQEPTLYQGTIKQNILLGSTGDHVTDAEVEEACRAANIYDFVMSLPEGLETVCGSKGALLSGGQKQRIAIARALVRKPKILLLDEATSALDSESEKIVQEALDRAAKGRTTIAVAHVSFSGLLFPIAFLDANFYRSACRRFRRRMLFTSSIMDAWWRVARIMSSSV